MTTVKELIELLQGFDPDALMIMQRDPEGNGYAPLSGAEDGTWDADAGEYGYAELTPELESKGYYEDDMIDGEPAVVLWPAW